PSEDEPGRATAAVERGARRDEPGGPATDHRRRDREVPGRLPLLRPGPSRDDRRVAGLGALRHLVRVPRRARLLLRAQLVVVARPRRARANRGGRPQTRGGVLTRGKVARCPPSPPPAPSAP